MMLAVKYCELRITLIAYPTTMIWHPEVPGHIWRPSPPRDPGPHNVNRFGFPLPPCMFQIRHMHAVLTRYYAPCQNALQQQPWFSYLIGEMAPSPARHIRSKLLSMKGTRSKASRRRRISLSFFFCGAPRRELPSSLCLENTLLSLCFFFSLLLSSFLCVSFLPAFIGAEL